MINILVIFILDSLYRLYSDAESESRDSINSASASLPVRLMEFGVTAGPHSEYVLRLRVSHLILEPLVDHNFYHNF